MSRYLVFATISLTLLLYSISGTAVSVAFPEITSSFDASLILAGWVLSIHQLVATAAMPLVGRAGDILGRKPIFIASLALFIIGSFLCAIAPNIELLIFFRFIQGIGGGGFLPIASSIVAEEFPQSRQRAIGLFTSIFPIGQIIGPNLGGWMVEAFGWRSIFWFNVPLGIIALVVSIYLLRAEPREKGTIDALGAGLFTASLFTFMTALSELGNGVGPQAWLLPGLLFVASVIFMVIFLRHEGKSKNPILELQVLRKRPFLAANFYNLVLGVSILGIMSFIPLFAVSVYGMSVFQSGLILTPRSIGAMAASTVTSIFLTRWGYRWPILFGTIMMVISFFLLGIGPQGISIAGINLSSTFVIMAIMFLSGIGMGVAAPAANNACIELMPDRVATIVGVRGMFRQSGAAISISVTTLLLHNIGDMARGFVVVFFATAVVMAVSIPSIFAMPKSCQVRVQVSDKSSE